jgi:hypothetical protein
MLTEKGNHQLSSLTQLLDALGLRRRFLSDLMQILSL